MSAGVSMMSPNFGKIAHKATYRVLVKQFIAIHRQTSCHRSSLKFSKREIPLQSKASEVFQRRCLEWKPFMQILQTSLINVICIISKHISLDLSSDKAVKSELSLVHRLSHLLHDVKHISAVDRTVFQLFN